MRKLLLFATILFSNYLFAQIANNKYAQLVSVNEQWKYQTDVSTGLKNTEAKPLVEHQLIQTHLQQTENLLRSRDVSQLSPALQKQRAKGLDILHEYWNRGLFPINEKYEGRQPYFIDAVNTYCAVGYIMQHTGGDDIAKEIKATQNFSYLMDIHHPKLMSWVAHSGFTLEELALIQVPYAGVAPCLVTEMHYNNIGTDVNEFFELRQALGGYLMFDKLLFYDQSNTLYKTVLISQMQKTGVGGPGEIYTYTFPSNENFSDAGSVEIVNSSSGNKVIIKVVYNQSSVIINKLTNDIYTLPTPTYDAVSFSVGESETTAVGQSLTFCGLFLPPSFWTLQPNIATKGVVNSCLVAAISLSKFDYSIGKNTVILNWQTSSQISTDQFEIERSNDGINFEKIGSQKAAGQSATVENYSFIDQKPNYINHYRLKEITLDGKTSYSKILFVKAAQSSPIIITTNPVNDNLPLQISRDASKIKSIVMYNFMGQQLQSIKPFTGFQNINVSSLASGKYLVQMITTDGQGYNIPFVKTN